MPRSLDKPARVYFLLSADSHLQRALRRFAVWTRVSRYRSSGLGTFSQGVLRWPSWRSPVQRWPTQSPPETLGPARASWHLWWPPDRTLLRDRGAAAEERSSTHQASCCPFLPPSLTFSADRALVFLLSFCRQGCQAVTFLVDPEVAAVTSHHIQVLVIPLHLAYWAYGLLNPELLAERAPGREERQERGRGLGNRKNGKIQGRARRLETRRFFQGKWGKKSRQVQAGRNEGAG